MEQTVEELQAQAREIELKLIAIQEEKRRLERLEYEKEQEAIRQAAVARTRETNSCYAGAIIAELIKAGYPKATWKWESDTDTRFIINPYGDDKNWHQNQITLGEIYTGYSGKPKPVIEVGRWPTTKFPLKKDGTFNYEGIVKKFLDKETQITAETKASNEKEARRTKNTAIADRVKTHFGISHYSDTIRNSEYEDGKVIVKLFATLTEDEATKFMDAIIATGLWKPK